MIDGRLLAVFQPFIDTATGHIAGVEALARLQLEDSRIHSAGALFSNSKASPTELPKLDRNVRETL